MADINSCVFTGRLTRDAETKTTGKGTTLCTFDIAVNTGWGDYAKTLFVTCNLWGKAADSIAQYLVKGKLVGVSGQMEKDEWTSQRDGSKQYKYILNFCNVTLLAAGDNTAFSAAAPDKGGNDYEDTAF